MLIQGQNCEMLTMCMLGKVHTGLNKMKAACKAARALSWKNDLRIFLCGSMEVMVDLGLSLWTRPLMLFYKHPCFVTDP